MKATMVGGGIESTVCASALLGVAVVAIAWREMPAWIAHSAPDR